MFKYLVILILNQKNGSISIHDNVKQLYCRFVAAREGKIVIGKSTNIATGAIFNGGGDIIIGENCIFGPRNILNANEHIFKRN